MEQPLQTVSNERLLHSTVEEMAISLTTALNGVRMHGNFNPEKHLARITELIQQGAPLNKPSHTTGTIFDTYWNKQQKCTDPSCKEHKDLFGKLLTAILLSEASKATTRKEQRALYNTLENQLQDLIEHSPTIDTHVGKKAAIQLLKKWAQGLPMPPFKK